MPWDITRLTVNHSSPLPLHYQLSQLLCTAIASGDLKPGDCLPPETDMVEHLGISRATVRQAISGLVNNGLLYRKKGKGTFVAAPKIEGGFFAKLESFHQEMLEKGLTPSTRVLQWEQIPPDGEINAVLELLPDAPLLLLRRLRFANGMPVVQVDTYLSAQLFGGLLEQDMEKNSLYQLLESVYHRPVIRARRSIEAINARPEEAKYLETEPGSALFLVKTVAYSSGSLPVEYSIARYRGDNNKFTIELTR